VGQCEVKLALSPKTAHQRRLTSTYQISKSGWSPLAFRGRSKSQRVYSFRISLSSDGKKVLNGTFRFPDNFVRSDMPSPRLLRAARLTSRLLSAALVSTAGRSIPSNERASSYVPRVVTADFNPCTGGIARRFRARSPSAEAATERQYQDAIRSRVVEKPVLCRGSFLPRRDARVQGIK
jgi:hypothetical protein